MHVWIKRLWFDSFHHTPFFLHFPVIKSINKVFQGKQSSLVKNNYIKEDIKRVAAHFCLSSASVCFTSVISAPLNFPINLFHQAQLCQWATQDN